MRGAFVRTLIELAEADPRILLLTGDLGYTVVEAFADRYPDRFFNVGVAEQNMIGLATGLSDSGYIPFVYSIATFVSMRAYEFIRNGPILHDLPVRVVAVGGGFEYGHAGPTHHAVEDVGLMRLQPGMRVICPADHEQTAAALTATWDLPGPTYYRIGKDDRRLVPRLHGRFRLGRAESIREGADVLLIAMGGVAAEVAQAAEVLAAQGVSAQVVVVASVNPAPIDDLSGLLARYPLAVTVEEHYLAGGIGSLVAEVIAEHGLACRLVRRGVNRLVGPGGSEDHLRRQHGLARDALVASVLDSVHSVGR